MVGYENSLNKIRKTEQKEFILEKLEEHKQRLLKYPLKWRNIKDGYDGGIRESNMMYWMAKYFIWCILIQKELIGKQFTEEEFRKYRQTLEFIFQVRNALHNVTRKNKISYI